MRGILLFGLPLLAAGLCAGPALAQAPVSAAPAPTVTPPVSALPVPNELELAKLIWSTMATVNDANQSGNYSVLRDTAAPAFQITNDAAQLAAIFAGLRSTRLDLSNALLLAPTYAEAPRLLPQNVLQVRGYFGLRPTAIKFDLQYQWASGRWRLYGVSIVQSTIAAIMPGTEPPPPARGK